MTPIQIKLRNFKCFNEEVVFRFPTQSGLYLIQGQNKARPELEGNGCGKSTLFGDALSWCLYGKTPRLLKAGDIISWEVNGSACVELEFANNGKTYNLIRTQSPNTLQLVEDGQRRVVDQLDVDHLLGMDFSSFISSVVFPQFGTMFFDLSPADKSALLSNILDLSVWDKASDQAKKSAESLQSSIQVTRERMAKNEGLVAGWLAVDLDAKIAEWEERKVEKLEVLQQTQANYQLEVDKISKSGLKIEKKLKNCADSLLEVSEIQSELKEELEKWLNTESELKFQFKSYHNQGDLVLKEKKKFQNVDGECPYCHQTVEKSHILAEIAVLDAKFAEFEQKKAKIAGKLESVGAKIAEFKEDLALLEQTNKEFAVEQRQILEEKSQLKAQAAKIMGQISRLKEEINGLKVAINPHLEEQNKQQAKVREIQELLTEDSASLKALDKKLFSTQYWIKAFKEVRLTLIGDVLVQLELEVNNKLFQLGLVDWRVDFAVEGLTKGGKVRKGFTATITTPQNLEPVPWAAWSGGETQRLRLAGALGLADLIAAKSGQHVGFEVYDEPSQYLSAAGIESMVSVLRDRATSMKKSIFLIDHRHLDSTNFAGMITVVKSTDGCAVVSSQ